MADQSEEPDRFRAFPHPREAEHLIGHGEAQQAILSGLAAGKLHHAWLIGGPEGIGKATFAYQTAKLLLGLGGRGDAPARFAPDPAAQASRLVVNLSHPDLFVLRRQYEPDKKKVPTVITVDAARRALDLFGNTAGAAGWRVCIVDSAEDLNVAAANALLKLIEEPPPRSIFLIVAHQPQRVLATIRSRCRKLALRPLADHDIRLVLAQLGSPEPAAEIDRALRHGDGSVRRVLTRLDPEVMALIEGARAQLARLPEIDVKAVLGLADTLAGRAGEEDFAIFMETVEDWIIGMIREGASAGAHRLAPLTEVWEKTTRAVREIEVFNIDRRPRVLSIFRDLAEGVTRMRMG